MAGFSASTYVLCRAYTSSAIQEALDGISGGMTFKGSVPTIADLPSTHNVGDYYIVQDPGCKAVWYNGGWIIYDEIPHKVSQLENDEQFIGTKQNAGAYVDNIHVDGSGTIPSDKHEYLIKDIQFKRGTAGSLANIIPKAGEPVFEFTSGGTYRLKIGDGTRKYSQLPYIGADFVPDVDGRSINLVGTNLQIFGFAPAPKNAILRKSADNKVEWVNLGDLVKSVNGIATKATTTVDTNGVITQKIDVLFDGATIKVASNKLYVPIDNDTIKLSSGKLTAKKTVGDNGVKVTTNADGNYLVEGNYKAGDNINFVRKTDGIYINSTASGGVGVVQAGDGIKVTTAGDKVTISGDYQEGPHINITKNAAGKLQIGVDPSAVENTYRPVKLNGNNFLGEDSSTGYLNYSALADANDGIEFVAVDEMGGKGIRMNVANKYILQAEEIGTPNRTLSNLNGKRIALFCGNAENM